MKIEAYHSPDDNVSVIFLPIVRLKMQLKSSAEFTVGTKLGDCITEVSCGIIEVEFRGSSSPTNQS